MIHLGHTRSCQKPNHLLQTPDTFIRAALPGMTNSTAVIHAAPATGAGFTQYTAEMSKDGKLGTISVQRFVYVLEGEVTVECAGTSQKLAAGGYCYVPAGTTHTVTASEHARLVVIEKPYSQLDRLESHSFLLGRESDLTRQTLLGDRDVQVAVLLPDSPRFDFAVNTLQFQPGASLPMTEVHVMEHGLVMLAGGGIYRLGDCWHPTNAGDFIYMGPFCPQWFGALGKEPAKYLLYKDWNRHPQA